MRARVCVCVCVLALCAVYVCYVCLRVLGVYVCACVCVVGSHRVYVRVCLFLCVRNEVCSLFLNITYFEVCCVSKKRSHFGLIRKVTRNIS